MMSLDGNNLVEHAVLVQAKIQVIVSCRCLLFACVFLQFLFGGPSHRTDASCLFISSLYESKESLICVKFDG